MKTKIEYLNAPCPECGATSLRSKPSNWADWRCDGCGADLDRNLKPAVKHPSHECIRYSEPPPCNVMKSEQMIKWDCSRTEMDLILRIADRAESMGVALDDRQGFLMDLEATHCNGCPLDLQKLLAFPNFDFAHDIGGIRRHINRRTGELMDCFLPRCARHD